MLASMETVGGYVASVETVEYRQYVQAQQELVASTLAGTATADQQARTELLRVRAVRAAERYPAP